MSSGGMILETNQCLIHSSRLVRLKLFLLSCLLVESCPEESTKACLCKEEAMTSSSLTTAQSGNCLSLKKRGMEQECRKTSITLFSSVLSCPSFLCLLFTVHLFLSLYPLSPSLASLICCVSLALLSPYTLVCFRFLIRVRNRRVRFIFQNPTSLRMRHKHKEKTLEEINKGRFEQVSQTFSSRVV